jgi:hypothetical protein
MQMFFYEIHEGDDELGTAVLLAHENAFSPDEFFSLVKKAKALLSEAHEEDTLSEAIANELERSGGFVHVTDDRLLASVNVGETDADTFLVTSDDATRTVFVRGDKADN